MIEVLSVNQRHIRTVLAEPDPAAVRDARRERERFMKRLWRRKNRDKVIAYHRATRAKPGAREKERERKRIWRAANRPAYNAYSRRYYELNPGRREYKARKAREYRERDRRAQG